jgi:hypothetical protein
MLNKKLLIITLITCSLQGAFLVSSLFGNKPLSDRIFSDVIDEFKKINLQVAMPMILTASCTGDYADEGLFEEPLCAYLPIIYSEMKIKFLDAQESQVLMNDRRILADTSNIRLYHGSLSGYDASVFSGNTIKIHNSSTGEILHSLEGHCNDIMTLIELGNGYLVSAEDNGHIKVWDIPNSSFLHNVYSDGFGLKSLIPISNTKFASLASHGSIEVWDAVTGERVLVINDENGIYSVCKLHNGALACVDKIGVIKIIDLNTGCCLHRFDNILLFAQPILQKQDGNLVVVFSLGTHTEALVLEIYPQAVQRLTLKQYALLVGLQNCKKENVSVMLHEDWVLIFKKMPDYFQNQYHDYVYYDDQCDSCSDSDN